MPPSNVVHALSVDVEDWFQVLNMRGMVDRAEWEQMSLRCGDGTRRILDLFARRRARATFFFLGWIAERLPDLVRDVAAAGHEIGSHGYDHRLLHELGPAGFDADLRRTEDVLHGILGRRPVAFRACTWSVSARTRWALPALAAHGYAVDSSIFPVRHPDYGVPRAPAQPYRLRIGQAELVEFPPLTLALFGRRLPVGGGGYLRLLPLALLCRGLRQQAEQALPGCVYLHPWEVDPDQPRRGLRGLRGFRHYVGLRRTLRKLDVLLQRFRFAGLSEALAAVRERLPVVAADEVFGPDGAATHQR